MAVKAITAFTNELGQFRVECPNMQERGGVKDVSQSFAVPPIPAPGLYGYGGDGNFDTTAVVELQTSHDGGTTWLKAAFDQIGLASTQTSNDSVLGPLMRFAIVANGASNTSNINMYFISERVARQKRNRR